MLPVGAKLSGPVEHSGQGSPGKATAPQEDDAGTKKKRRREPQKWKAGGELPVRRAPLRVSPEKGRNLNPATENARHLNPEGRARLR